MFKSIIFRFFAAITISYLGYFIFSKNRNNEQQEEVVISLKDYLLGSFISELPEINKKLPYKIDDHTILNSIKYKNSKVLSIY